MDLRTHYPFSLLRYGLLHSYPSLKKDIRTDVAIIGAGITGALVAWELQKKGIACVVTDKRHVAMGSTAASTSLLQYEIDQPLYKLMKLVGKDKAIKSYLLCRDAIGKLKKVSRETGSGSFFQNKCSLQYASFKKDVAALEKECRLRQELGFKTELLDNERIRDEFYFNAPAALYSEEAAQVDAYVMTHGILHSLDKNHSAVFDHTPVVSVEYEKRKIRITTADGFIIQARKLVIACGYESSTYLDRKFEDLRCTYALVSEPISDNARWNENCLIWETADPYLYMRSTNEKRILVGGKDTAYMPLKKQTEILGTKARELGRAFHKLFPQLEIKIDFTWAGAFAATHDGLPYIGCLPDKPNTYFALGYGGNGITFSAIAAEMISAAINGDKHPGNDIFSFER